MTTVRQQPVVSAASSNGDEYLTTAQVQELLDVSRGTLYRLESEGKLKPMDCLGNKILKHRRLRFSKQAVEKLMEELNYNGPKINS